MKSFILSLCLVALCGAQTFPFPGPRYAPAAGGGTLPTSLLGLQFWVKADAGTNCNTDTCAITSWNDQSGNANNLTCSNVTFAASVVNSLPSILGSGTAICTFATSINLQSAMTIFAVYKPTSTAAFGTLIAGGNSSFQWLTTDATTNYEQGGLRTDQAFLGGGSHPADTNAHQGMVSYDNTTFTLRLDRSADGSFTPGDSPISSNETVLFEDGATGGERFTGHILEIFAFNRVLNSTEITQMETYLNGRYGL